MILRLGLLVWILGSAAPAPTQEPPAGSNGGVEAGAGVERAAALLRDGRPAAAREVLLAVVAAEPRHGGARVLLGRIELERGDAQAARLHLEIAVTASPPRPYLAWHLLARARLLAGSPALAVGAWDQALELAPRFAPALLGRARANLRLGRVARAAEDAERALALDPRSTTALFLLTEIRLRQDRPDEAGELLSRIAAGADTDDESRWTTLSGHRRLLEAFPDAPVVAAAAARNARAMGALALAECLVRRAVRARPADATDRYLLAVIQAEAGRYDEAAASCRRAIELGLEEAPVYATLGLAEFERMNIAASIEAYSRALALDPRAAGSIPRFALAALTTEEFAALRDLLRAHLRETPEHRETLYSLGVMSLRENELAAAREYLERLEALAPDDLQVHYNLGSIHLRLGDRERGEAAMARFRRLEAIEAERWLEHNRAHALRLEARAAAARGEPEKAIEIYGHLAAAGTADQEDYLAAGRACLALGDFRRAHGWFEGLLEVAPFHREALRGLAAAAAGLGREDEERRARARVELLSWECDPDAG